MTWSQYSSSSSLPTQTRPWNFGSGLPHRLCLVFSATPHVCEHADHSDHTVQPPWTVKYLITTFNRMLAVLKNISINWSSCYLINWTRAAIFSTCFYFFCLSWHNEEFCNEALLVNYKSMNNGCDLLVQFVTCTFWPRQSLPPLAGGGSLHSLTRHKHSSMPTRTPTWLQSDQSSHGPKPPWTVIDVIKIIINEMSMVTTF